MLLDTYQRIEREQSRQQVMHMNYLLNSTGDISSQEAQVKA
jgi:hypothetical protein